MSNTGFIVCNKHYFKCQKTCETCSEYELASNPPQLQLFPQSSPILQRARPPSCHGDWLLLHCLKDDDRYEDVALADFMFVSLSARNPMIRRKLDKSVLQPTVLVATDWVKPRVFTPLHRTKDCQHRV